MADPLQHQIKRNIGEVAIGPLLLSSGVTLDNVTLSYEIIGAPSNPTVLVCHALTGNQFAVGTTEEPGWWSGLIGSNQYIDTNQYQLITFNVLGGCHGSTGPNSINPNTGEPYRNDFPDITIRDMVHAQNKALAKLNISTVDIIIGGSLGGMQVMEWGLLYPDFMKKLIILAATPSLSDYGIAFNHIAETVVKHDANWNNGHYDTDSPIIGLEIARMIGMVTYRSPELFSDRFKREQIDQSFSVSSYLDYQGKKLATRFDPNSYLTLLRAMNSHDIGTNRGGWRKASTLLNQPILLLSFDNDLIYTPATIQHFADSLANCTYHHVKNIFGHDGFLTEYEKWGPLIQDFLNT
ncbi:homoserine O-acetyltransferase MetX [Ornithinibacillus caprae]|uniref:homoserine O-acetyltransferase MetX n=1 Tax=Ornithinibacillus caprae TaxID=2678566 RepID=UPI0031B56F3B